MAFKRRDIDIDLLRKSMDYDPEAGIFTVSVWRASQTGRIGSPKFVQAGRQLGYLGPHGYWVVGFQGRKWLGQVLAWAYVHGEIPAEDIDHENRIKTDNRIDNLRKVSRGQNMRNCERHDRRGAALGTTLRKDGLWASLVSDSGRTVFLGAYPTQAEAHAAHQTYVEQHSLRAQS